MKFAIVVNEAPYTHQASDSAYHFAVAALAGGHEIVRVFFYHDGVHNASRLSQPPQDERRIGERWAQLAAQHRLELAVCIAAAQRRGVLDAAEQHRHGVDANNIAAGFKIAGLGQLVDAAICADRVITFGD